MNKLPTTPAEARQIAPASMTVEAFQEVVNRMKQAGASKSSIRGMARLIACHGQKYTAEARAFAAAYAENEAGE